MLEETIQSTLFPKGCNPANPRQTSATGEMAISIAMEAVRTRLPRKARLGLPAGPPVAARSANARRTGPLGSDATRWSASFTWLLNRFRYGTLDSGGASLSQMRNAGGAGRAVLQAVWCATDTRAGR